MKNKFLNLLIIFGLLHAVAAHAMEPAATSTTTETSTTTTTADTPRKKIPPYEVLILAIKINNAELFDSALASIEDKKQIQDALTHIRTLCAQKDTKERFPALLAMAKKLNIRSKEIEKKIIDSIDDYFSQLITDFDILNNAFYNQEALTKNQTTQELIKVLSSPLLHLAYTEDSAFCENSEARYKKIIKDNKHAINDQQDRFFKITPLMVACFTGNATLVHLLLKANADTNLQDFLGRTALHYAVIALRPANFSIYGYKTNIKPFENISKIVGDLLKFHANINIKDNAGFTPLMLASLSPMHETVALLIAQGADCTVCEANGFNALTLAQHAIKSKQLHKIYLESFRFARKKVTTLCTKKTCSYLENHTAIRKKITDEQERQKKVEQEKEQRERELEEQRKKKLQLTEDEQKKVKKANDERKKEKERAQKEEKAAQKRKAASKLQRTVANSQKETQCTEKVPYTLEDWLAEFNQAEQQFEEIMQGKEKSKIEQLYKTYNQIFSAFQNRKYAGAERKIARAKTINLSKMRKQLANKGTTHETNS